MTMGYYFSLCWKWPQLLQIEYHRKEHQTLIHEIFDTKNIYVLLLDTNIYIYDKYVQITNLVLFIISIIQTRYIEVTTEQGNSVFLWFYGLPY